MRAAIRHQERAQDALWGQCEGLVDEFAVFDGNIPPPYHSARCVHDEKLFAVVVFLTQEDQIPARCGSEEMVLVVHGLASEDIPCANTLVVFGNLDVILVIMPGLQVNPIDAGKDVLHSDLGTGGDVQRLMIVVEFEIDTIVVLVRDNCFQGRNDLFVLRNRQLVQADRYVILQCALFVVPEDDPRIDGSRHHDNIVIVGNVYLFYVRKRGSAHSFLSKEIQKMPLIIETQNNAVKEHTEVLVEHRTFLG